MIITDIAQYLEDEGVGTLGTNIFAGYFPDNVDSGVCVIDTGGVAPDPDLPTRNKTFQVFIRGTDYETGQDLVDTVRSTLHQISNQTIGSFYFYYVLALSDGGHIGRNDRGIDEFSINFQSLIR